MIISWIRDGLGNQMFRYAAGRRLALKLGTEFKLCISWHEDFIERNTEKFEKQIPLPYRLNQFNIYEKIASLEEVEELKKIRPFPNCGEENRQRNFEPNVLNYPDNVVLFGLRQSEKYFSDISETIRQDFTLKEYGEVAGQLRNKINDDTASTVSLHFRRQTYLLPDAMSFHGVCTLNYYQSCLRKLSKRYSSLSLYVFSDDITWVKENLKTEFPVCYVSAYGTTDAEEIALMSLCDHNIISNSTFSWWGAWLNANPEKQVYVPARWSNHPDMLRDVVPESWIKVDNNG